MTSKTSNDKTKTTVHAAEIVREYGPFAGAERVHGVTHDGQRVWAATGAQLIAFDPESGAPPSTALIFIKSQRSASTRSTPPAARSWRRSRRPARATTQG
jgi:hypothetical protein